MGFSGVFRGKKKRPDESRATSNAILICEVALSDAKLVISSETTN